MKYVQVVINNKNDNTDNLYTYFCNDDSIIIGSRVLVPFGQGNRVAEGYVFSILEEIDIHPSKVKSIKKVLNDEISLSPEAIDLCRWMKEKYGCRYIDAVHCFIPAGSSMKKNRYVELICEDPSIKIDSLDYKIMIFLREKGKVPIKQIIDTLGENVENRIDYLKKKGIVHITERLQSKAKLIYETYVRLKDKEVANNYISNKKNAPKQAYLIDILNKTNEVSCIYLKKEYGIELPTIRGLESNKIVEVFQKEKRRVSSEEIKSDNKYIENLTDEQNQAIQRITPFIDSNCYDTFLVHGVTGSGKTEIYMQLIQRVLSIGKRAIVLVPEISLTLQMIERFKGRFGEENLAVLHSKLSIGERYDEWIRIKRGHVKIVIGARSSLFAPLKDIGIIIIDEEHESSYKSDHTPKYDAIETAKIRAELNNAVLVLGSATPTISSYYKAEIGDYQYIELKSRYNEVPMPAIEIVDMREELQYGNKSIFSKRLYDAILENLENKKQVILFLNRRGYASFVSCRSCGYVLKCNSCGISLTYHSNSKSAVCHYCGIEIKVPNLCPECNSKYFKYFGAGTEKVEEIVKKVFPNYSCARLDLDTSRLKGSTQKILTDFRNRRTDILIGTQIIAKGLDFPNVGLVGIIASDISLNIADFRASERTFQLITQAAGRAGRGNERGKVIVQTYKPGHYAITTAKEHDYSLFYQNEIILRRQMEYPPFTDIIQLIVSGAQEEKTEKLSQKVVNDFVSQAGEDVRNMILGPRIAPRQKINEKFRFQILIKCKHVDQKRFMGIIDNIKRYFHGSRFKDYNIMIDINPYSFM